MLIWLLILVWNQPRVDVGLIWKVSTIYNTLPHNFYSIFWIFLPYHLCMLCKNVKYLVQNLHWIFFAEPLSVGDVYCVKHWCVDVYSWSLWLWVNCLNLSHTWTALFLALAIYLPMIVQLTTHISCSLQCLKLLLLSKKNHLIQDFT